MARPKNNENKFFKDQDMTELVRKVARELYEKKGCKPGHDLDNWLEAEKLVKSGKA
ncbi:MAG: DUF2934 domain-containing protein [Candidatus Omnitrophica bacterium]|jgi:hypothetical protein|nr:DUF2934 domain-containing protein [Candidatus Omnitrophota bacterium]